MLRSSLAGLAAGVVFLAGADLSAQLQVQDWTERPDAFAPAGVFGDRLPGARALDFRLAVAHRSSSQIVVGTDEVPPILVLEDWNAVPLEQQSQRAVFEVTGGITDGLALAFRAPFVRNQVEFATYSQVQSVSTSGVGDLEAHLYGSLHRSWPVRAHVGLGASFPTGSVSESGSIPTEGGTVSGVHPYALQTGAGVVGIIPSAVVAMENRFGTTGIEVSGRIYTGENDRDWRPGNHFTGSLFMQSRLNDWFSISARIAVENAAAVQGSDAGLSQFASPLHTPWTYGGTRIDAPVGLNLQFREGWLEGHRLGAELLLPIHSDLNGPQLRSGVGVAVSWGYTLGSGARSPARVAYVVPAREAPPAPAPTPRPEAGEAPVEAAPRCAPIGAYAAGTEWYEGDLALRFEDRTYVRAGGLVAPDCTRLVQVGAIGAVPLFVMDTAGAPYQELLVPVREGAWQGYRVDLARVRG